MVVVAMHEPRNSGFSGWTSTQSHVGTRSVYGCREENHRGCPGGRSTWKYVWMRTVSQVRRPSASAFMIQSRYFWSLPLISGMTLDASDMKDR